MALDVFSAFHTIILNQHKYALSEWALMEWTKIGKHIVEQGKLPIVIRDLPEAGTPALPIRSPPKPESAAVEQVGDENARRHLKRSPLSQPRRRFSIETFCSLRNQYIRISDVSLPFTHKRGLLLTLSHRKKKESGTSCENEDMIDDV